MGQMEDMSAFVRIVEAGTISRAAEQLGVAKSAVSRRLVDLENRMNVQLLNRTTRKSSLTEAGRSYYQRARQILADVSELHASTSNAKATLEGDLKVAVPHTFGQMHLAPVVNEFAKTHPGINFHLDFSDRQVDLVEEGFDVAIRIAELKDSSYIARKLVTINLVLCASPEYLNRAGHPEKPVDLVSHDILDYVVTSSPARKFLDRDGQEKSIRLSAKMSANNGDYLCAAAVAGLGITALPTFIAWKELNNGSLIRVMGEYSLSPIHAYAVYPQTRHLSKRVRTFIDFMIEKFGDDPSWDACLKSG